LIRISGTTPALIIVKVNVWRHAFGLGSHLQGRDGNKLWAVTVEEGFFRVFSAN